MLKLYHGISSVCSVKVRLGLAEMGLEYEEVVLDLPSGDQHAPAYLKLNPNGVVPTLVDRDLVLLESSLILEYLDREHNGAALMPKGRSAEAATRYWLLRCIAVHDAINTLTFSTAMRDRILSSKTPDQIAALLAAMPNPAMRMKRKDLYEHGMDSGHVDQALVILQRCFDDMSETPGAWVCGDQIGLSDIALLSYLDRLQRLGFEGLWASHPKVGRWLAAMQARPSYAREVADRIPAEAAASMRQSGLSYWPKLAEKFAALPS